MKTKLITTIFSTILLLPVFASAEATTTIIASSTVTLPVAKVVIVQKNIFTLCSQTAIEKRDTTISEIRVTYNTKTQLALDARKTALQNAEAITMSSDRIAAKKIALHVYRDAQNSAQSAYSTARKGAWSTYDANIKSCRDARKAESTKKISEVEKKKIEIEKIKEDKKDVQSTVHEIKKKVHVLNSTSTGTVNIHVNGSL